MHFRKHIVVFVFLTLGCAGQLAALPTGAPPGMSGAPGDNTCTSCHGGNPNTGQGSVTLTFANGTTYTPGQTQRVTVTITDPNGRRWGFQASPRVVSETPTGAGALIASNSNVRIAGTSGTLQWITHTLAGTRPGTQGPASFEFDWTAPDTNVGDVRMYVAANAANNSDGNRGDSIYTTSVTLTPAGASGGAKPAISEAGVVNGASFRAGISAGSWITITGSNLASTTRIWGASDFVQGKLPTSLDNTRVTVNGKAAAVYYISPTQINAQAPDDTATGNVNVVVATPGGESTPVAAALQRFAPAFFMFDPSNRRYLAATLSGGQLVGPAALFGANATTRPARPGEIVILYGTGFGPTTPAVPAGEVFSGAAPLSTAPTIRIGGVAADVAFAGLSAAGLYQFNVTVPATLADGDHAVVATIGGVESQAGTFLAVQR